MHTHVGLILSISVLGTVRVLDALPYSVYAGEFGDTEV